MQVFDAHIDRAVAIELKDKVTTLYVSLLPIFYSVSNWTLNSIDPDLPAPFDVKVQLDAYAAITLERLKLTEWVKELQTAQNGDTLTYPTPPVTAGTIAFDEIGLETLNF
jgi:hypothetical protein